MKQLFTYFALAYFFSWLIWLPLYGHIFGLNNLPVSPFQHAFGALGPLMASLLTTFIFLKKDGVKLLLAKCFQIKPLVYFAIALLSPFILIMLASLISYIINKTPISFSGLFTPNDFPQFSRFVFFIYNLIFFGFGEELGWRGFALPRLQKKMIALLASFVLTLFWALWHLPMFFYKEGFTTMGSAAIFGWFFSLFTGSVLLTWLYNSSKASILVCAVFHTTIDIAFTANFADKNIGNYMGFLITAWGILTIIIFKPKKLAW
jgi:uncharacterized protein